MREGLYLCGSWFLQTRGIAGNTELDQRESKKKEVNKLFLATDNEGRLVFHVAAVFHNLEDLQRILKWAKKI